MGPLGLPDPATAAPIATVEDHAQDRAEAFVTRREFELAMGALADRLEQLTGQLEIVAGKPLQEAHTGRGRHGRG